MKKNENVKFLKNLPQKIQRSIPQTNKQNKN